MSFVAVVCQAVLCDTYHSVALARTGPIRSTFNQGDSDSRLTGAGVLRG